MSITEFLEARIAEEEADARRAADVFPGRWDVEDRGHHAHVVCDGPSFHYVSELDQQQSPGTWLGGALKSVANFQPARVLAECAAKRAILAQRERIDRSANDDEWSMGYSDANYGAITAIAAVYADHPDYQQEWA